MKNKKFKPSKPMSAEKAKEILQSRIMQQKWKDLLENNPVEFWKIAGSIIPDEIDFGKR